MTMQLIEEAYVLAARIAFRDMVAPHPSGSKSPELRRLYRLRLRARTRYSRRKRAFGGAW